MENQDESKLEQDKESAKESDSLHKQQVEEDEIIKSDEEFAKDYPFGPPSISTIDQEMRQQEFSDYFNDGYNLAKNDPELYDQVLWEAEDNKERSNALIWGRFMFEQEMQKDVSLNKEQKVLSEIRAIRGRNKTFSKVKTIEPEPFDPRRDKGFRGFINALEKPAREAAAMQHGDSDRDETERDYE